LNFVCHFPDPAFSTYCSFLGPSFSSLTFSGNPTIVGKVRHVFESSVYCPSVCCPLTHVNGQQTLPLFT